MKNRYHLLVRLFILTALLSFLTSCTIEKFSQASSSDSSFSNDDSSIESAEISSDTSVNDQVSSSFEMLIENVEPYMTTLVSGDLEATCKKFSLSRQNMILPPTYECDGEIYRVLYTNMTYSYGVVIKKSEQDFDLEVISSVPDLPSCVQSVFEDESFMIEASAAWVVAICEKDSEHVNEYYLQMLESVLSEAIRRIDEGEFTKMTTYSDFFELHDNINSWNVLKYPEYVTFLNQDHYMSNLTYMSTEETYSLICTVGARLVEDGKLKQDVLEKRTEELRIMIEEADSN